MARPTLTQLAAEAEEELSTPTVSGDDGGPPVHPGAEGSGNPLLDEAEGWSEDEDDPVDNIEVDRHLEQMCRAVANVMERTHPGWRKSADYRMLVQDVEEAIRKHATPKKEP